MVLTSTGVILRRGAVEVIQAQRGLTGLRVTRFASAPIVGSEDADAVNAIREALEHAGVSGRRVAVCVPAQEVLLRSFTTLLVPRTERKTTVQFEAAKYLPFKTDELTWRFSVEEQREAKQMRVVFISIRTESLARVQGWLGEVGLTADYIEAPACSLARLVRGAARSRRRRNSQPDEYVAVADIQPDLAHIVIAKDETPYLARDVSLLLTPEERTAQQGAADPAVEKLLSEVRQSLEFFMRDHPSAVLSQLWLFGEPATVEPWCEWLAAQLACPVRVGRLPISGAGLLPVGPQAACAIGLAAGQLRPARLRLNFIEPPAAEVKLELSFSKLAKPDPEFLRALQRPAAVQASLAVAALAALAVLGNQHVAATQRRMEQTIKGLPDVGWGLQGKLRAELESLKKEIDARLSVLEKTIEQRVPVTQKLDRLVRLLPDGMWIEGLKYQGAESTLTLDGACFLGDSARELDLISDFVDRLKEDQRLLQGFSTARLAGVMRIDDRAAASTFRRFKVVCEPAKPPTTK